MKKYFLSFLFLCATSLVAIGQSKVDSLPKLKLFVKNLKGEMVYLRAYLDKGTPVVDSLLIKSDNDTMLS